MRLYQRLRDLREDADKSQADNKKETEKKDGMIAFDIDYSNSDKGIGVSIYLINIETNEEEHFGRTKEDDVSGVNLLPTGEYVINQDKSFVAGDFDLALRTKEKIVIKPGETTTVHIYFEPKETAAEVIDPSLTTIDPFEFLKVEFTGLSPHLYVKLENTSNDPNFSQIEFERVGYNELAIGDEVVIKVSKYKGGKDIAEDGYRYSVTEKTYKVENADKFLQSFEELTESELADIKTMIETEIKNLIDGYSKNMLGEIRFNDGTVLPAENINIDNLKFKAYYYGNAKGSYNENKKNILYLLYTIPEVEAKDGKGIYDLSYLVEYAPLIRLKDGTLKEVKLNSLIDIRRHITQESIDKDISNFKSSYNAYKIDG